jgi:hypothetical protein
MNIVVANTRNELRLIIGSGEFKAGIAIASRPQKFADTSPAKKSPNRTPNIRDKEYRSIQRYFSGKKNREKSGTDMINHNRYRYFPSVKYLTKLRTAVVLVRIKNPPNAPITVHSAYKGKMLSGRKNTR